MTTKQILLEQFNACYSESAWFASAKSALENLTAEEVFWKPSDAIHSVWEILAHLNFWNERWLHRFKGEEVGSAGMEIAETFVVEAKDWETTLDKFNSIMSEWKNLLKNANEAKFGEHVSAKIQDEWAAPIAQMNIHNAYHIGQLVLVRKLKGSWDASRGVS